MKSTSATTAAPSPTNINNFNRKNHNKLKMNKKLSISFQSKMSSIGKSTTPSSSSKTNRKPHRLNHKDIEKWTDLKKQ